MQCSITRSHLARNWDSTSRPMSEPASYPVREETPQGADVATDPTPNRHRPTQKCWFQVGIGSLVITITLQSKHSRSASTNSNQQLFKLSAELVTVSSFQPASQLVRPVSKSGFVTPSNDKDIALLTGFEPSLFERTAALLSGMTDFCQVDKDIALLTGFEPSLFERTAALLSGMTDFCQVFQSK